MNSNIYNYDPTVTEYNPNIINNKVFEDKNYQDLVKKNPDINQKIKNILKQEFNGYTVEHLAEKLEVTPIYLNQILSLWNQYHCTYFAKYGRIIFNPKNNHWIFIPNWHPQSRISKLRFEDLKFYR
tara:strand:- start:77 stop:454 length:378 start_codon:yes stop_codon:yes gene_type:complete